MRPKKHKTTGSNDLFRARLDQIINLKHELVRSRHPSTAQLGFLTDDQTMRGSPTRNRAFACGCLRRLRYAGDGDMAAAATSLSRDLRSWSCGSGSIPIVDKMCSQR